MFNIDVQFAAILIGTALPILVGIVSKLEASSRLKASLLALLSAAGGVLAVSIEGGGIIEQETVIAAATTYIAAVATYYGFWKPTGVTPAVQSATPNVGLG